MAEYTRFTNLEVTGKFKAGGGMGLTEASYSVSTADAAAAAGSTPTAAEFKKVVDLANDLKTNFNKLVKQLATGSDT